jgi:hypothetical protein
MKSIFFPVVMLVGIAASTVHPAHADTIQTGNQRYQTNDGFNEHDNTLVAQRFCRSRGFAYAHIIWTTRGMFIWEHDKTDFYCMRPGDEVHMNPSTDIEVDILPPL